MVKTERAAPSWQRTEPYRRDGAASQIEVNGHGQTSRRWGASTRPTEREAAASQRDMRRRGGHHGQQQSTQPSQGHGEDSQSPLETLSNEETHKLVAEVMRHMLFKSHQQPGVPVRREELTQLITKTYKQRFLAGHVISMAQIKMLATFGFEMKEYLRTRSSKPANAASQVDVKEYVLIRKVPDDFIKNYIETPDTAALHSLTVLVIGIIKYSGGERVPEEKMWQNLARFGIKEELDHPRFGNIKTSLDAIAKQRYIQKEKLTGHDGEGFVYGLAERALDKAFQTRLGEFISTIVSRDYKPGISYTPS